MPGYDVIMEVALMEEILYQLVSVKFLTSTVIMGTVSWMAMMARIIERRLLTCSCFSATFDTTGVVPTPKIHPTCSIGKTNAIRVEVVQQIGRCHVISMSYYNSCVHTCHKHLTTVKGQLDYVGLES